MIVFKNTNVEAWKVRQGVVVSLDGNYYHIMGFVSNTKLAIADYLSGLDKPLKVEANELVWLEGI